MTSTHFPARRPGHPTQVFLISFCLSILALLNTLAAGAPTPWDTHILFAMPTSRTAPGFSNTDIEALFLSGPDYHGKATEIFAWFGKAQNANGKSPAMVLIHGGGGTAFAEWVRLWNRRGYHAIAIDTTGSIPQGETEMAKRLRHDKGGPDGWGGLAQLGEPATDQWPYHAVAAAVRGHSFLLAQSEVDKDRTGVTGISWGGYLTCMVAGLDPRFHLAIPVYGCGFFHEDSAWKATLEKLGGDGQVWTRQWDASHYLPLATLPMLWVSGTSDHFFPMPSWQKSYRLPKGPKFLALRPGMPHSHGAGWSPAEIATFADHVFKKGPALPAVTASGENQGKAWVTYNSPVAITAVEFNFTSDEGPWESRWWMTRRLPAGGSGRSEVLIPPEATVYYFNVVDQRGLLASSEHVERKAAPGAPQGRRYLVDEDFEADPDGLTPNGTVGIDGAKGAVIVVTNRPGPGGKKCLAFIDAPGLSKAWEPFREWNFKGNRAISNGTFRVIFDFQNDPSAPARFTAELRDNSEKQYRTGALLEFGVDGQVSSGKTPLVTLPHGTWAHVEISVSPGNPSGIYKVDITRERSSLQSFNLPLQNPAFGKIHWLGFVPYNDGRAICYIDNLQVIYERP